MTHYIIFGCGAIGSQMAMHLASPDNTFVLIDDDVVSENNVFTRTSAYSRYHIGAQKCVVLSEMLYQKAKCIATPVNTTVTPANVGSLHGLVDVHDNYIIDAFDNMQSRSILKGIHPNLLHAGVSLQRTGSVMWDYAFPIPNEIEDRHANPVCTNQLGAPILRLTSAIAVSVLENHAITGKMKNYWITESLQVQELML